ncbi:p24 complex component [Tieghemiomyces parasiticus]|uniref:P24 complex component n=1 Tax=Tieghemiomyces parasiticus TaxID=78921 RepID=A0A9W7ZV88_9FUNG|nr:p24 complex component [Tieghemiomyces parasiticus]
MRHLPSLILALCCALASVAAYTIRMKPYQRECYVETLTKDAYYTISYEMANNDLIDFTVSGPGGRHVTTILQQDSGNYDMPENIEAGEYEYCFINPASSATDKILYFHAHGLDPNELMPVEEKATPLEKEVIHLSQSIELIVDHLEYMTGREQDHRNTAESTNSRVKWWSATQIVVVCAACAWQIWYLKSFFEVKRIV